MLMKCCFCKNEVDDVCPDGACEACHDPDEYPGSVSWSDCCDGTYSARMLLRLGHSKEEIKKNYPDAKI